MVDKKIENTEEVVDETLDDENEETVETPEQKSKSSKSFSQDEVNKLVQNRIARERESAKKLKEEWESLETSYKEQIEKYEEILSKQIEDKLKDLPEAFKKIVQKLPILEQLEFLADEKNTSVSKKQIPQTPKVVEGEKKETKPVKKFM